MNEQETSELRERIEGTLRERHVAELVDRRDKVIVRVLRERADSLGVNPPCALATWCDTELRVSGATELDALTSLAATLGLNADGSDPRAEVERLRAIVERHAAEKAQLVREAHEAMEATVAEAVRYYSAAKDRMQKKVDAACAERDAAIARAYAEERERDAVRDAAREYLDARAAYDVANAYDATNADDERRAWDRRAAAQGALAALVGGSK